MKKTRQLNRPAFRKTVFPNGLTLLTERQRGYRSLSVGIWVKAGTRHETPREAGISHFLEHMLFKGTKRRSALDIAREVDRVGGDFNAFTSRENTCFHVLMLDRDVELAVDVLCDTLLHSTFDAAELERERKVILQEVAMVEESPEEVAHDLYFELVFGGHSLGRPILGSGTSVKRLSRAEILRFFRKNYRPDQIVIAASGDVTHAQFVKLFQPLVKRDWPGRPRRSARAVKVQRGRAADAASGGPSPAAQLLQELRQKPPEVRTGCWWIERPTEQVHLLWGVAGTSYTSKDRFAAFLLNIYLGGGMSSSLFQEIREKKGLAYTVYSSLTPFVDSGVFTVYVATGMHQVALCLKLIEESVEKLRQELLTEDELQIIKDNLKGSVLLASDDVESRMSSIARNELFLGKYVSPEEVCRQIDRVTPHDVRRLARKLLSEEGRSVLALGPKPSRALNKLLMPEFPKRFQP